MPDQHDDNRHADPTGAPLDWQVMIVLLSTAALLTVQRYVFSSGDLADTIEVLRQLGAERPAAFLHEYEVSPENGRLAELIFWAAGTYLNYLIVPALLIKLVFRERLCDYGISPRRMFRGGWTYIVFFAVMIPLLLFFSRTDAFQARYPFYSMASTEPLWPRFWIWELFYLGQFFCLEFFFRGFIVHGTKHRFGVYSIFVMTVPYCMIHFGKPMPETFAAIVAGVVLGYMSLKTRSIWPGAMLHMAVAVSMDLLSLWHKGLLAAVG